MRGGIPAAEMAPANPADRGSEAAGRSDQLELAGAEDGFAAAAARELVSDSLLLMPRRQPA
jgi:hypothetical protein